MLSRGFPRTQHRKKELKERKKGLWMEEKAGGEKAGGETAGRMRNKGEKELPEA
jgi:hypothetical protein